MNTSKNIGAHIALSGAAIIYGLNYIIAKDVLSNNYITPFGFIMMRVLTGAIGLSIIHAIFVKEKMEAKDLRYAALCSIFGAMINMLCFFEGLKHTSAIHASLIMVLTPILVLIISAFIIKEAVTTRKIVGISLGLLGAGILIFSSGGASEKVATIYGDIMIMINAIFYGVYLVMIRRLTKKYHPITVIKWVFIFGALFCIPFGGAEMLATDWSTFSPQIWYSVAYVLVFTTLIVYLLNVFALSKVMPSTVGFYIYFQPLIATFIAILIGNDNLDALKVLCAVFLFAGVYLVNNQP